MPAKPRKTRPGRDAAAAFTLVELMISIALVLLLMLGINQVFRVTGEAVGTNQAVSTGLRDARAAQAVLSRDFNAWAPDSPAIIIRSERVSAFRNRADELADRDWNRNSPNDAAKLTIDLDGNGIEGEAAVPGEEISPAIYNHRSHRVDVLSFFARDLFRRQTGGVLPNVDEYVAEMSSTEAWIWYGHLRRPDERSPVASNQQFEHRDPGDNANPTGGVFNDRNFYATDFVLGRMAMLLNEGDASPPIPGTTIEDKFGRPQRFIARTAPLESAPGVTNTLAPLSRGIESNDNASEGRWEIQWSRYDLANTSINQFSTILRNFQNLYDSSPPGSLEPWYDRMGNWRFQGDPTPLKPFNPGNVARITPAFLANCSQFIVEYAGDFIHQHPDTGALTPGPNTGTAYEPDGQIDFIVLDAGTANETRQIRWYGMPRDVAGGTDGGPDGIIRTGASAVGNQLVDVVPLRDVLGPGFVYTPASPNEVFIERAWPDRPPPTMPGTILPPLRGTYTEPGGMLPNGAYIVAWGPDTGNQPRPKLIRIVVVIDDPEGRIADGQTFEYVFRVGG